jgi:hypothetical protein
MGFERMTPVLQQAKTVHALDRAAAMIGQERQPLISILG